jgi:hypothetical protein
MCLLLCLVGVAARVARIIISCLPELKDNEVRFLELVRDNLAASGHEFVLLSPRPYDPVADEVMPLPGDWRQWNATFVLDGVSVDDAMRSIDATKWLRRVQHIAGDSLGRADCLPLLESMAHASLAILKALQPGLFVGWNPCDPNTGLMHAIAANHGIPVSAFERGLLPDTLNVDPELQGVSNSLAGKSWDEIQSSAHSQCDDLAVAEARIYLKQAFGTQYARYDPPARDDTLDLLASCRWADLRPRVLVLGCFDTACALSPDDPLRLASLPGYESGFDLARKVARSHAGITLFKPHPCIEPRIAACDARPERNLLVATGDVGNYLNWADVVVSYGTTLEYAALASDRPVVLAGRSALFGKGIAYEAIEPSQLPLAVEQAYRRIDFDERLNRFHAFVSYLLRDYLIRIDTEEHVQRGAQRWAEQLHRLARHGTPEKSFTQVRNEILREGELAKWSRLVAAEQQLAKQQRQIVQQQEQITQQQGQIAGQQKQIATQQEQIAGRQKQMALLQNELDAILQSTTWRWASRCRRILDRMTNRRH